MYPNFNAHDASIDVIVNQIILVSDVTTACNIHLSGTYSQKQTKLSKYQ